MAVLADAFANRANFFPVGPGPDAGLRIGSDVGGDHAPRQTLEWKHRARATAGARARTVQARVIMLGVAAIAIGEGGVQIPAPLDAFRALIDGDVGGGRN